jgi:hypothetical protein
MYYIMVKLLYQIYPNILSHTYLSLDSLLFQTVLTENNKLGNNKQYCLQQVKHNYGPIAYKSII